MIERRTATRYTRSSQQREPPSPHATQSLSPSSLLSQWAAELRQATLGRARRRMEPGQPTRPTRLQVGLTVVPVVRWWVETATVFDAPALRPHQDADTPLKNPVQNPRLFRTSGEGFATVAVWRSPSATPGSRSRRRTSTRSATRSSRPASTPGPAGRDRFRPPGRRAGPHHLLTVLDEEDVVERDEARPPREERAPPGARRRRAGESGCRPAVVVGADRHEQLVGPVHGAHAGCARSEGGGPDPRTHPRRRRLRARAAGSAAARR